jgi:hypothetical protein
MHTLAALELGLHLMRLISVFRKELVAMAASATTTQ